MDTQVRTPQAIFMQPQRLLVPLFQRPYVWNEEQQWEPLWRDLERVAMRGQKFPDRVQQPHFLGAVVFQQEMTQTSDLQQRTVIDGQQRLTTLQVLLDALHSEILLVGAKSSAARLEPLIRNGDAFCQNSEDKFKVWPTNRDREAFNEVMGMQPPVSYDELKHKASRLAKAHRYFSDRCREWIAKGANPQVQAEAIERSAREMLQIVVIDLNANENAQEIFETLNARGAQLTAADLIKNFVFQRLLESKSDVETAYSKYWAQFETAFWEKEVSAGRIKQPRSSAFLNHWLIAKTGEEVVAREVFARFKAYADSRNETPMPFLLQEIHQAAEVYRKFVEVAEVRDGPLDRVGIFAYRVKALESEVVKPVLLALLDRKVPFSASEIDLCLDVLESWLTRRMLVRGSTKAYNQIMAEVVKVLRQDVSNRPGHAIQTFFASQKAESLYWPDDAEIRKELSVLPIYRKIGRGRLRMVLESIEDRRRGWRPGQASAAGMRIRRDSYVIEHVMPQAWSRHWPLTSGFTEQERDQRIHTIGNLTLLTKKLNSTVSNGPWKGERGKAAHLQEKDILLLNSTLLAISADDWDEYKIDKRTQSMIDDIIAIWAVPEGHKSSALKGEARVAIADEVADLISAGYLSVGQMLYSGSLKHPGCIGTILSDGRIDVDGQIFDSPSGAGHYIRQKATNGWAFWLVNPSTKKTLAQVRREYRDAVAAGDGNMSDDGAE